MDLSGGRLVIYGALGANAAIAVTKFVVAGMTGSSAMLSEGIHSSVDTANQLLLLLGEHRSQRPPDEHHPFGYGREIFFWSLIVAVLIFGVGGGVSMYEGYTHIVHPVAIEDPTWNYVVLGAAALFEGASFAIALRHFLRAKRGGTFWDALRASKDPSTYTVLAEDGAALLGLAIAGLGIWGSERWSMPILDGVASALIGVLLAAVAVMLVVEAHGLLIGEGVSAKTREAVRDLIGGFPVVCKVGPLKSVYLGPRQVLIAVDVEFAADASAAHVMDAVRRIEEAIRDRFPHVTRIYLEAAQLGQAPRGGPAGSP